MVANIINSTHSQNMPEHRILFVFFPCNTPTKAHRTGLIISGFIGTNLAVIAMEIDYSHMDIHSATIFKLDTAVYAPGNTGYLAGGPIIAYSFGLEQSI